MELSKKAFPADKIKEKEREIIEAIKEIKESYDEAFENLGYELAASYKRKGEFDREYFDIDETEGEYAPGYISIAHFVVKKKEDSAPDDEDDFPEDADEDEIELIKKSRAAERELKRSYAYTQTMIVRVYKSFWIERVSVADNFDELRADLDEFLQKLSEMKDSPENE